MYTSLVKRLGPLYELTVPTRYPKIIALFTKCQHSHKIYAVLVKRLGPLHELTSPTRYPKIIVLFTERLDHLKAVLMHVLLNELCTESSIFWGVYRSLTQALKWLKLIYYVCILERSAENIKYIRH